MTSYIDTELMCSHVAFGNKVAKELSASIGRLVPSLSPTQQSCVGGPIEEDGAYHHIWLAIQDDPEVNYTLRNRQLLIYRNVNKVLCLAGKAAPKIFREKDPLVQMLNQVSHLEK